LAKGPINFESGVVPHISALVFGSVELAAFVHEVGAILEDLKAVGKTCRHIQG